MNVIWSDDVNEMQLEIELYSIIYWDRMNKTVMEYVISVGDIPGITCLVTEGLYRLKAFTGYV